MKIVQQFIVQNDCFQANVGRIDSRYVKFQDNGPSDLMLHSVGCAQPSADVFWRNWNKPNVQKAVHAFIDANTGDVHQFLEWNYRGWHCGGSGNNTHIGVEMCESSYIQYNSNGTSFTVIDRTRAVADCVRAYHAAVELFAYLCEMWQLDPMTNICSHKEGYKKGIASNHGDPEMYWNGLGMGYSMDGFRQDVYNAIHALPELPFTDVDPERWSYEGICYCYEHGIMAGTSATKFNPKGNVTREQLALTLMRLGKLAGIE